MASRVPFIGNLATRLAELGVDIEGRRTVARAVRDLCDAADLPASGDVLTSIERPGRVAVLAHGRRVPGHNLWIWYLAVDDRLQVVGLTNRPPRAR